jgi:GTPase SAR1 family protein
MWDTAGQEKYRSIITSYFRNISSAIVTYDVTNKSSFICVLKWIKELDRFNSCKHDYKHPILLLGTKSDLNKERKVSFEEGFNIASKYGFIFREINSFTLNGPLESGFKELLETIFSNVDNEKRENINKIPFAEPYPTYTENVIINLQPESSLRMENLESVLITCKGVKCIDNNRKDKLKENLKDNSESPKVCSKCIIS